MRIGILGYGQLGRMLAMAGIPLGFGFTFYDDATKSIYRSLVPSEGPAITSEDALDRFLEEGFHPSLEEYCRRISSDSNSPVRFDDNRTVWEGTFESINSDGSYNLKLKNGEIKTFVAGEIMWKPI